jgi:hypothetical protein
MSDELNHKHDRPEHRQGEGPNRAGDEAINRQRVGREAEKHQDQSQDPADKEAAERRHSAARYRVLAAEYEGQDEVDPKEFSERHKAKEEEIAADMDDRARQKKEEKQEKR